MMSDLIDRWTPLFIQGLGNTISIWIVAAAVALVLGTSVGVVRARHLRVAYLSVGLDAITFFIRGVPYYVQLLVAYFVLPDVIGLNLSPKTAGIISLGICSAAYISQMVRGGINAIADEQWETAAALGLSSWQLIRFVLLPQCARTIMPMLCSELDQLLKSTSIISAIGVLELTRAGLNIIATDMQVIATYASLALLYVGLSSILNATFMAIERSLNYDLR